MNTLITIPFSHYCEKARWALQYCGVPFVERGHLPVMHMLPMRRAGGRTLPVLTRPGAPPLCDSTEIVQWADAQAAPARRLFGDAALRARTLELEDELDETLGPATRLWAYAWGFQSPPTLRQVIAPSLTRLQARALPFIMPLARPLISRHYRIDDQRRRDATRTIERSFESVGAALGQRRFLVGDAFSAADLTFAALASPVLLPPAHPSLVSTIERLPSEMRAFIERLRLTPAGQLALRLYRDHRGGDAATVAGRA